MQLRTTIVTWDGIFAGTDMFKLGLDKVHAKDDRSMVRLFAGWAAMTAVIAADSQLFCHISWMEMHEEFELSRNDRHSIVVNERAITNCRRCWGHARASDGRRRGDSCSPSFFVRYITFLERYRSDLMHGISSTIMGLQVEKSKCWSTLAGSMLIDVLLRRTDIVQDQARQMPRSQLKNLVFRILLSCSRMLCTYARY